MNQVIGSCSLCGGDVVSHVGPWMGVIPPRAHCSSCGALEAQGPVIRMVPSPRVPVKQETATPPTIPYAMIDLTGVDGYTLEQYFTSSIGGNTFQS